MSEEKKKGKGILQEVADFLEITEVKTGKPPARTQETPVHVENEPEGDVQPPEESAIEVMMPEPVEPSKIGEEGKRRRISVE